MKKISMDKVVETLKYWGYINGGFEELVVKLAEEGGFEYIYATVSQPDQITFEYKLNEKGKLFAKWFANYYGYTPIDDAGYFHDESPESVARTLKEWGEIENAGD